MLHISNVFSLADTTDIRLTVFLFYELIHSVSFYASDFNCYSSFLSVFLYFVYDFILNKIHVQRNTESVQCLDL